MSDQTIEGRINDIIETQRDLEEESEGLKRLLAMKDRLDELNKLIIANDNEVFVLEQDAQDDKLSEVERKKIELKAAELKERKKPLQSEVNDLQKAILDIGFEQDKKGNFNKRILFKNIRELLKGSDIKLGQIEKEAGCQPGYMSRLEKEGNMTDPSIEFIVTAAKLFDINLDVLLNSSIRDLTPTEAYMLKFLKNLMDDTNTDQITWIKDSEELLADKLFESMDSDELAHPLFTKVQDTSHAEDNYFTVEYKSLFYGSGNVDIDGNSYHAILPGSDSMIYFMACIGKTGDADKKGLKRFFEIYIVEDKKISPICCSNEVSEPITKAIEGLYKAVEISATHVHINNNARDAIDRYFSYKDAPF